MQLVVELVHGHDTPSESDPGEGIKTAFIRAGSKLWRVFVYTCQGKSEYFAYLTRTSIFFQSLHTMRLFLSAREKTSNHFLA